MKTSALHIGNVFYIVSGMRRRSKRRQWWNLTGRYGKPTQEMMFSKFQIKIYKKAFTEHQDTHSNNKNVRYEIDTKDKIAKLKTSIGNRYRKLIM